MSDQPPFSADGDPAKPHEPPPADLGYAFPQPAAPPVSRENPPRIWPAMLALFVILPALVIVPGLIVGIVVGVTSQAASPEQFQQEIQAFVTSEGGLILMSVPMLLLLGLVCCMTVLSPEPWRQRLSWQAPDLPIGLLSLGMLGALGFSSLGGTLIQKTSRLLFPDIEQVPLEAHMVWNAQGFGLVLLPIALVLLPGLVEELFFRGYLQKRLLQRWSVLGSVLFSGVFFALYHVNPPHVLAVLGLGVYLSWLAWASRSIFPAIVAHMFNNAYVLVMLAWLGPEGVRAPGINVFQGFALGVCLPVGLVSVVLLTRRRWTLDRRAAASSSGEPTSSLPQAPLG